VFGHFAKPKHLVPRYDRSRITHCTAPQHLKKLLGIALVRQATHNYPSYKGLAAHFPALLELKTMRCTGNAAKGLDTVVIETSKCISRSPVKLSKCNHLNRIAVQFLPYAADVFSISEPPGCRTKISLRQTSKALRVKMQAPSTGDMACSLRQLREELRQW
jgi:hypothetical protein